MSCFSLCVSHGHAGMYLYMNISGNMTGVKTLDPLRKGGDRTTNMENENLSSHASVQYTVRIDMCVHSIFVESYRYIKSR